MGKDVVFETLWGGLLVTVKIILYLWLIIILFHLLWQLPDAL